MERLPWTCNLEHTILKISSPNYQRLVERIENMWSKGEWLLGRALAFPSQRNYNYNAFRISLTSRFSCCEGTRLQHSQFNVLHVLDAPHIWRRPSASKILQSEESLASSCQSLLVSSTRWLTDGAKQSENIVGQGCALTPLTCIMRTIGSSN